MFNKIIVQQQVPEIDLRCLFRAAGIYLFKPHVVNRKLFGVSVLHTFSYYQIEQLNGGYKTLDIAKILQECKNETVGPGKVENSIFNVCERHGLAVQKVENFDLSKLKFDDQSPRHGYVVLNKFLPRNLTVFHPLDVLAIIDFDSQSMSFSCLQDEENTLTPKFAFSIQLEDHKLSIKCVDEPKQDDKSFLWLKNVLFQRLLKWIENNVQKAQGTSNQDEIASLSLINNLEEYNCLYSKLKSKYGTEMVKIWPETTDPKKYVYEDVAIATYLLLLWKQEREESGSDRLQSFVDIGCGNGLLVYILVSEGHDGLGIDLRKRKIWNQFPANVTLKEQSIVPSDDALFPEKDWIIGNHSDELSPWIPVLAARSAYRCRFFLLPCCAFEFDGTKFQRQNSSLSQYNAFLRYVEEISIVCGFETAIDRLKIPSTKRTCLIGSTRTYREEQFSEFSGKIQSFIDSRTSGARKENNSNWSEGFRPRENVEKVRNCTKVERSIIDDIVRIVFNALIAKKRMATDFPGRNWNAGGRIGITDLIKLIPQEKLNSLKSECGGLQTLLKNNHQIFHVLEGSVQLRIPTRKGQSSRSSEELKRKPKKQKNPRIVNLKEKSCWFYANHPDGCPFEEQECKFKHS